MAVGFCNDTGDPVCVVVARRHGDLVGANKPFVAAFPAGTLDGDVGRCQEMEKKNFPSGKGTHRLKVFTEACTVPGGPGQVSGNSSRIPVHHGDRPGTERIQPGPVGGFKLLRDAWCLLRKPSATRMNSGRVKSSSSPKASTGVRRCRSVVPNRWVRVDLPIPAKPAMEIQRSCNDAEHRQLVLGPPGRDRPDDGRPPDTTNGRFR